MDNTLERALYEKYIAPTQRDRTPAVGVELEFPIVSLMGQPVNFGVVHQVTEDFIIRFGFTNEKRDDEGSIYAAESTKNGDCISFDCSYNTLELSFGKEESLHRIYDRFVQYYSFLQERLLPKKHTLTGMGINPGWQQNRREPIPNGRYRMLLHHLSSFPQYGNVIPFHNHPDFGLFSCASQVQLDVERDQILRTLRIFSRLEPYKSLLFANSLFGSDGEWLLSRDWFWRDSLHGLNRKNVDFYDPEIEDISQLLDYISKTSIFCTERNGNYLHFRPIPVEEYFRTDCVTGTYYKNGGYHVMTFQPELSDLAYLRSYKLEDLTYRGTIEYRSVCQQPVSQVLAPAAFHAGIAENLNAVEAFLDRDESLRVAGSDLWNLRNNLNHSAGIQKLDRKAVSTALLELLDLTRQGLGNRSRYEAQFLKPLYERAERLQSPAQELSDRLRSGEDIGRCIEDYAALRTG